MRELVADKHSDIFVSAASAWEISTKCRLGKLGASMLMPPRYRVLLEADGFAPLAVSDMHALVAGSYPRSHVPPATVLATQAEIESLSLVSRDRSFQRFGIETLWGTHEMARFR
jgi:PIN domain nuclease of toxin-antitoxin system